MSKSVKCLLCHDSFDFTLFSTFLIFVLLFVWGWHISCRLCSDCYGNCYNRQSNL